MILQVVAVSLVRVCQTICLKLILSTLQLLQKCQVLLVQMGIIQLFILFIFTLIILFSLSLLHLKFIFSYLLSSVFKLSAHLCIIFFNLHPHYSQFSSHRVNGSGCFLLGLDHLLSGDLTLNLKVFIYLTNVFKFDVVSFLTSQCFLLKSVEEEGYVYIIIFLV